MSIFKETFKDFVFKQFRIREAIIEQGNNPSKFKHRLGRPRVEIQGEDGSSTKVNIAAGAFYTNTVNKQCVIRMVSGVDVTAAEELLEKGENLAGSLLAKNYILEGGVLGPDNKPRAGFTTAGINSNPAYGDSATRSDAKDGFGIVPMPGIVDADIRTKTAYGSLREAKVNFVCHNRRQLEVLELLYMRPGFPILLEWQWSPFINNENGQIDNKLYGIKNDWFDENKTINELNLTIIEQKTKSSGNYDGFIGFCKNFEITSRPDGGYNCTTEIIAAGEVLESLKARNDGFSKEEEDRIIQIDNMQMLLEGLLELGELHSRLAIRALPDTPASNLLETITGKEVRTLESIRKEEGIEKKYGKHKLSESELIEYQNQQDLLSDFFEKYDEFYLWKGDKMGEVKKWYREDVNTLRSKRTYVRWDHLCDLINNHVFPLPNPDKPDDPLVQLTYTQPTKGKYNTIPVQAGWVFPNDPEQYIEYAPFEFPTKYYKTVNNEYGKIKEVKKPYKNVESILSVEDVLNNSFDPSVCLLPNQNRKNKRYAGATDVENAIGHIFLNVDYLLKTYMQMAYSNNEPKDNFNFFDYIKKIWGGVNKACVGNYNFILQTELERPNRIRIIDLQVNKTKQNIKPEDLFEFKIQSNKSIVRDFNFNTTIPSSLTATIGIAAQAPTSVSELDQVTFANFSKGIKSRFTSNIELSTKKNSGGKNLDKKEIFEKELKKYKENVVDLGLYIAQLVNGDFDEEDEIDDMSFSQATSLASTIVKQAQSLNQKSPVTGERRPIIPSRKSAVIPLKFNAAMDGISGMVIGNVFKVEKEKLPKGYQADDIAFVVMGESQKITSGQDWTTEISGQLMLLDLGEEETIKLQKRYEPIKYDRLDDIYQVEQDNTRVVQDIIVDEIVEDDITHDPATEKALLEEFFPDATIEEGDASLGNENEEEKPPNEQDKIEALRGNGTKYIGDDVSPNLQVAKGKARMNALKQLLNAAGVSNSSSVNISGFIEVDIKTTQASSGLYTVTRTYELR